MTYAEFQTRICNLRCDLEELANDCHNEWVDSACQNEETFWYNAEEDIQQAADIIADYEETEDEL